MASFICEDCRETHGSELDDEEYLEEEDEELSDEEPELDDEKLTESIETTNNHQTKVSPVPASNNKRKSSAVNSSNLVNGSSKTSSVQKSQTKQSNKRQKVEEKQQSDDEELFCICRTPYNESQFYVQCEKCNLWVHGR